MDKAASRTPETTGYPPYADPDPSQNLVVVGSSSTPSPSCRTSPSYVAVLLAGISLLVGTVVHVVSFSLPYWFKLSHDGGVSMGLWNIQSCSRRRHGGGCLTESIDSVAKKAGAGGGVVEPESWFLALRAMETIGLIASFLTCALFIALLIRPRPLRQVTLELRNAQEMGHNPLRALSQLGRIFLIFFTALLYLAGLSIIVGLVVIFCQHDNRMLGMQGPSFAVILSGFSGFTFLIGGTLAAAGMCEILSRAK